MVHIWSLMIYLVKIYNLCANSYAISLILVGKATFIVSALLLVKQTNASVRNLFSHATLVAILEKGENHEWSLFHFAINLKRSTILSHYYFSFSFTHGIYWHSCSHFKLYVCCWLRDNCKDWHDLLLIAQLSYRLIGTLL